MTPDQLTTFLIVLYVGACLGLYGVISLISKFEDEHLTDGK